MDAVCRAAAAADIVLTPHCEDSPRTLRMMSQGHNPGFVPGRPYANEAAWIERDVRAAQRAGCRMHVSHVSLARSVEVIENYRRDHRGITYEVAPHHLLLAAEDYAEGDVPTVNPPLRTDADRRALCQALESGSADVLASDHAPHTAEDKARGASGLIGLETTLGLVLTRFVGEGRLSRERAVTAMSLQPARVFGLPAGTLSPGSPADMVLIDPAAKWTVEPEGFRSKSRNCPYAGWRLRGKAVATYVAGAEAFAEAQFNSRKGRWDGDEALR
jgi:dihydroorotase